MTSPAKLIIISVLLLIEFTSHTVGISEVLFKSVQSRSTHRYISNHSVEIVNGTLYTEFQLIRRLDPGVRCHLEFQLRIANSKRYQSLFFFDIDICGTIIALKDHFLKSWYRSLMKYSNFMENCPFNPDRYYLKGWKLDASLFPKYLYPGDYNIIVIIYNGPYRKRGMDLVTEVQLETNVI
ncbi:uncharacterized protein LOC101460836 [Ceratitis capitata]|uniref:(Mediterranean fruit fly) hypothetical protein n=1 Tax=Ceratitis capitata TaxID=7213 RepID=A0A811V2V1_CERCA|nr:uncharacterized protein LOC101460836 [Ceratitis capitata]CAD7005380.1 unnamed protein product [Ceratitis capitata]